MGKYFRFLILFSFLLLTLTSFAASSLKPVWLTTEYTVNPISLNTSKPRLSWKLMSDKRGQMQTAYEILVSDNSRDIHNAKGTTWQSGKIASSLSIHIDYAGAPLKPFTRYYWRVKVYDQNGEVSAWSEPAFFETGILQPTDWKGVWIGDERKQFEKEEDFYGPDQMPLIRKGFTVPKTIAAARLYISGLGYYEAFLNGKKIGDHVLDPGFTTYKKQALYASYDITPQIRKGKNVIGIMLGNGWYNPLPLKLFGRFNLRTVQQTGRPCVKAQILLSYTDGTSLTIATDETWKTALGPVIRNNVYLGEQYDARLEKENWLNTNYDDLSWKKASKVEGPSGELVAQMQPPIKITRILKPIRITEVGKDTFIVDMGQNFAGVARIRVQAPAGRKISMRFGEDIHPNGRLNYLTTVAGQIKEIFNLKGGPGAPKTAWQEDNYITKGKGIETWAPQFTFHGFRYVEITGWPGRPTVNDIEGLRMNSNIEQAGTFSCSNQMFNQLNDVIQWTFLSNVFSVQSDCPGREKMGYGADIVVTSEAFMYNYDMANFYRKTVQDFVNEQQPDGGITEIAPYTGIADKGYGGESGPLGWQLAFPYLQKKLYDFYGDKRIIENNYAGIIRQMDFLQSKAIDGLFHWDISDHEALDPKPEAFSAASFYYHHAVLAANFAAILGKKEDSLKYAKLSETIKNAIVRKYLVPHTGRFDNATQSAQLFALWYRLAPSEDTTMQVLLNEFARHNNHVSTGIFATKWMFDVLREKNRNDVAYKIANQPDYPGWGYMLSKGATTLWETWKYPDNAPSQNHPMFGSISEWFYRSLLGINSGAPGFEKIIIKPQPAGDLQWAKGSYESVRGAIVSDWKIQQNSFTLNVSVPANTTAEIWLPSKENTSITENGKAITAANGITSIKHEKGYTIISTGSGNYQFTSSL